MSSGTSRRPTSRNLASHELSGPIGRTRPTKNFSNSVAPHKPTVDVDMPASRDIRVGRQRARCRGEGVTVTKVSCPAHQLVDLAPTGATRVHATAVPRGTSPYAMHQARWHA